MNSAQALTFGDTKAMKKLLLTALSSLAMGAYAADDHKFYAGGGLSTWNLETGGGDLNLKALEGVAGYKILPWLDTEFRLGLGIERDRSADTLRTGPYVEQFSNATPPESLGYYTADVLAYDQEAELSYYASLYLKPKIANDRAALYGLIGFTNYDIETSWSTIGGIGNFDLVPSDGDTPEYYSLQGATFDPSTAASGVESNSETALSLGIGVSFFFERYTVNAEWKNYSQSNPDSESAEDIFEASGFSANVTYSF